MSRAIKGGGTTDASQLTSGTIPNARINDTVFVTSNYNLNINNAGDFISNRDIKISGPGRFLVGTLTTSLVQSINVGVLPPNTTYNVMLNFEGDLGALVTTPPWFTNYNNNYVDINFNAAPNITNYRGLILLTN